ncbi:MAG: ABC transporter permease, partial [Chitinophagales bacterium]
AIILFALLQGVYGNMIKNIVSYSSGYLQMHAKNYWEDRSLDDAFVRDTNIEHTLEALPNITQVIPRIETFALASTGELSASAMLTGMEPDIERHVSNLDKKVVSGRYLTQQDNAVLISAGLAKKLQLEVNDTILILTQGYHAANAYGKYAVKGLVKLGSPDLNNRMVYLPLRAMQYLLSLDDQITAYAFMVDNVKELDATKKSIQHTIDTAVFAVMDWKEMMPEMDQLMKSDSSGNKLMVIILYIIISFGLFSTILMMITERQHELGIMIALGMQKYKLAFVVFLEVIFIAITGVLLGSVASLPVIEYLYRHPIQLKGEIAEIYIGYGFEPVMPVSKDPSVFLSQAYIVLAVACAVAIYPVIKILRMRMINALSN